MKTQTELWADRAGQVYKKRVHADGTIEYYGPDGQIPIFPPGVTFIMPLSYFIPPRTNGKEQSCTQ